MSDEVLRHAAEIYAPFGAAETQRLREFVEDVEAFSQSAFFKSGQQTLTISWQRGGPLTTNLVYPGEEAVRAVVALFRQIYTPTEPTSFRSILKLLQAHVHERGSEHASAAIALLKEFREVEKKQLHPSLGLVSEEVQPDGSVRKTEWTPALLIDLFLHGKYLHKGNAKSSKLGQWPIPPLAQQVFFETMTRLQRVWWVGANVVREVLKVPELLDAAPIERPG